MPYASSTTVASGSTQNVSVPFNFIQKSDVNVTLNGVLVTQSTLTWLSSSVIQLPSLPAAGVVIVVSRTTQASTLDTQFQDPSVLEGSDLNEALLQMLYIAQEAFDAAVVTATELTTITDYVNTAMANAAESATAAANSALAAAGIGAGLAFLSEGNWDASTGMFPGGGTAPKNGLWRCSVAGTVAGVTFNIGDSIYAIATNASTSVYTGNWQQVLGSLTQAAINAVGGGWSTGDVKLTIKVAADAGWLLCQDQTIGNVGSGAAFASASAQALYLLLYSVASNTYAPVTGGRGASGAADWAALKPMQLTAMLGRALGIAGAGSGLTSRAVGQTIGEETHLLSTAELPAHAHTITDPGHFHTISQIATVDGGGVTKIVAQGNGGTGTSTATGTTGITTTNNNTGGAGAHNNMQPTSFLNAMIKL